MAVIPANRDLARYTTDELSRLLAGDAPVVGLLPVGAVEPHGPHLPLLTDIVISTAASVRGAELLERNDVTALIAPPVPYGVTECAAAFAGAVSVPPEAVTAYVHGVVEGLLRAGLAHVCVVNNHLEPEHDGAIRVALDGIDARRATVASPLTRRWARTLSAEFKSGACHAGCYETSILMRAAPEWVKEGERRRLPAVDVSLSEALQAGESDFVRMGLERAYAGAPADATAAHGREQIDRLGEMVATTLLEALSGDPSAE